MPEILFIAQAVGPVGGSHSTRTTHLIRELANRGWGITVCTIKIYPGAAQLDYSLLTKIPDDVNFIRSFPGPLHALAYSHIKKSSVKVRKSKFKKFMIPDTYIEWLPFVLWDVFIKKSIIKQPDVILSSAVPYTSHLIALVLKRFFKVPWIADYGDPWVFDPGRPRKGFRFLLEKRLEDWVVENSDRITVTTETTKKLYQEKFSIPESKIVVLPMAYDPDDFKINRLTQAKPAVKPGKFVYVGTLEPESRNGEPFFQALQSLYSRTALAEPLFDFYGLFREEIHLYTNQLGLARQVKFHPWIDNEQCMKKLAEADCLLLFGNKNSIQIPGKVYNYIGSGTPIIYIADPTLREDPVHDLLKQSGVCFWYVENSVPAIRSFFQNLPITASPIKPNYYKLESFTWSKRGEDLSKLLDSLINTTLTP